MSGDNYRLCPRCKRKHEKELDDAIRAAREAYGKVSQEDHAVLVEKAERLRQWKAENSLREDYECYVTVGGKFVVSYGCHCSECSFSHEFNHQQQLSIDPKPPSED